MRQTILLLLLVTLALGLPSAVPAMANDDGTAAVDGPDGFTLSAAYPNPFNPRTSFSLTVEERQEVMVKVYNLLGVEVEQLFDGVMDEGETRTFTFTAGDLPSGIYLYRVQGETFTSTRQMTLLK